MGYYDENDNYREEYYDYVEPIGIVADNYSEREITDVLCNASLISEKHARLKCTMEKLIFAHGNQSEVYSMPEIQFIESIEEVFCYTDFSMELMKGNITCRVFATVIDDAGYEALKACVSFEKIVNKAFDSFNIFLFVTQDSVMFGCTVFEGTAENDCTISKPIQTQVELEQMQDELSMACGMNYFTEFYSAVLQAVECDYVYQDYFEDRYAKDYDRNEFGTMKEIAFETLVEEVEESLSFIKSNRINTYEMLFEADEMMKQAEETELDNQKIVEQTENEESSIHAEINEEENIVLDDPEEMIKLLKKRRGI